MRCSNRIILLSHIRHIKVSLRRQICICQKHFVILFTYCVTANISLRQVLRSDSSPCRKSSLIYLLSIYIISARLVKIFGGPCLNLEAVFSKICYVIERSQNFFCRSGNFYIASLLSRFLNLEISSAIFIKTDPNLDMVNMLYCMVFWRFQGV